MKSVLLAALFATVAFAAAYGEETCPPGAPSCKVLILTQDEIRTLEGPGLIFDSAIWANRANLTGLVDAWKQKIASAPAGKLPPPKEFKPEQPKETPKEVPKK